jgi:RNA polymerase sigma-70 factor (ECF subfamily)
LAVKRRTRWLTARPERSPLIDARERPERFDAVFVAYWDNVLRFMVRRTFDPEVAFDITAETFTTMLAHLHDFRGDTEAAGQAWMWRIARSQLTKWHESGSVERRNRDRLKIDVASPGTDELERIEELADTEALRRRVRRALTTLQPGPRRLLEMRVVQEWSYDEVAVELGISTDAARVRIARALAVLRAAVDQLADDEDEPNRDILISEELLT